MQETSMPENVGANIQKILKQQGKTAKWLAGKIGLSENSVGKILRGQTPRSGYIPEIARVIATPISALYGEDLSDYFNQASKFTLADAPVCVTPYKLKLNDELPFLPENSIVWIAPATPSDREIAKYWVFRGEGSTRAVIRRAVMDGDYRMLVPLNGVPTSRQRSDSSIPEQDGTVLGVVRDVVSCAGEFLRS